MNEQCYSAKEEYAVSTFTFENYDLETALDCIAAHGFHTVELWADKLAHVDPRILVDHEEVRELLKRYNMHVHSLHTPFRCFRPFLDIAEGQVYREEYWKKSIDFCEEFGIPVAVIHAMDRIGYNYNINDLPYVHDLLQRLAVYANEHGVKLALENIPNGKDPVHEINCTLENLVRLFSDIKELSFCLDIGHVTVTNNDMAGEISAAGSRLITFHIHNNDGKHDLHNTPDQGMINWPLWHDVIRKNGYEGQFVFEVCGYDDPFSRMDHLASLFEETED